MATNITLPAGFRTTSDLWRVLAGHAYIADYAARYGDISPKPEPTAHYDIEMVGGGTHPECYIDVYADGSAYIHSNAENEIWESFANYLSENDLTVTDGLVRAS